MDTETTTIKEGIQNFIVGGIYDGKITSITYSIKELIQQLLMSQTKYCYIHNLSYDYRFLLDELENMGISQKIITSNSQILSSKLYLKNKCVCELRDSYAITRHSLKNLCKHMSIIKSKKEYDYTKLDKITDYTNILNKTDREELEEYLKYDLWSLYEILIHFHKFYDRTSLGLTTASNSMQEFESSNKEEIKQNSVYDSFFRLSYHGGLTQVYKPFFTSEHNDYSEDHLYYYDVNSLYPFVMQNNTYPTGKIKVIDSLNINDCNDNFLCKAKIEIKEDYNPSIPIFNNNILCFPKGKIKGFFTSIEIKYAIEKGYNIDIEKLWSFENDSFIFTDFISKYYKLRKEYKKDDPENLIAKLTMNSLYGKFSQRDIHSETVIVNNEDISSFLNENVFNLKKRVTPILMKEEGISNNIFTVENSEKKSYTQTHISCFITANARDLMFKKIDEILKEGYDVYYCDTDSIITNKKMASGIELGEFKLEDRIIKGVFPLGKTYAYINSENKEVVKTKGFFKKFCYQDINDFIVKDRPLESKELYTSSLKKILKKYVGKTECYNLEKKMQFSKIFLKRKYDIKNNKTTPIII